ncbi:MAG: hypothetical protein JRE14_14280 [Deltaproteobacteria bacterium]|nr:hypothetical protein [Deltaproteobacteria bacterium]
MCQMRSIVCVVLAFMMLITVSINPAVAKSSTDPDSVVTSHEPKTRMSEVKKDTGKKSGKMWLWILLGAVVVAGGAAAIAGGGDDSSSTTTNTSGNTGSISGSW